jgi:hypothetical protein
LRWMHETSVWWLLDSGVNYLMDLDSWVGVICFYSCILCIFTFQTGLSGCILVPKCEDHVCAHAQMCRDMKKPDIHHNLLYGTCCATRSSYHLSKQESSSCQPFYGHSR